MKLGTYTKQPTEKESYTISYAEDLTLGDNVKSATAEVTPAGLTVDNVFVASPRVRFWVSGGTVNVIYKVTVTTTTEDNRVLVDEVIIKIKDY
jgi:hypothetical protein